MEASFCCRRISTFLFDLFMCHDHFGYMVLFLWSSQLFLKKKTKKNKLQTDFRTLQLEMLKFDQKEKLMFRPPGQKYCA